MTEFLPRIDLKNVDLSDVDLPRRGAAFRKRRAHFARYIADRVKEYRNIDLDGVADAMPAILSMIEAGDDRCLAMLRLAKMLLLIVNGWSEREAHQSLRLDEEEKV
jgi:hypothetical protein